MTKTLARGAAGMMLILILISFTTEAHQVPNAATSLHHSVSAIAGHPGNWWMSFMHALKLGVTHISEGADHLLFLVTLLLSAPLIEASGEWYVSGTRYSLIRIFQIAGAFIAGHSLTLIIGSLGWFSAPSQLVEIGIAISILVVAIHIVYPVFGDREALLALGLGLIHGLSLANTFTTLDHLAGPTGWTLTGFNFGIILMLAFLILLVIPPLLLLSQTDWYPAVRIGVAILASAAAFGWLAEFITLQPNAITDIIIKLDHYRIWIMAGLAGVAIISFALRKHAENTRLRY